MTSSPGLPRRQARPDDRGQFTTTLPAGAYLVRADGGPGDSDAAAEGPLGASVLRIGALATLRQVETAAEAERIGLVNRVMSDSELLPFVRAYVEDLYTKIAALGKGTVATSVTTWYSPSMR